MGFEIILKHFRVRVALSQRRKGKWKSYGDEHFTMVRLSLWESEKHSLLGLNEGSKVKEQMKAAASEALE